MQLIWEYYGLKVNLSPALAGVGVGGDPAILSYKGSEEVKVLLGISIIVPAIYVLYCSTKWVNITNNTLLWRVLQALRSGRKKIQVSQVYLPLEKLVERQIEFLDL